VQPSFFDTFTALKYKTMALEETINNDLKAAMMAKDAAAMRALRAVKAALLLAKTEKAAQAK
jgi:uncharacterized protein YqeY